MAAKKPTKMKARKTTARAKATTKKATPRGVRSATRTEGFGTIRPINVLRVPADGRMNSL